MTNPLTRLANWWLSYAGAERFSEKRSTTPGRVQDVRWDCDYASRWEIVRKSRSFERNDGLCSRLCDLFEEFTVGENGIQITPGGENEPYNQALSEVWGEWQRVCDIASLQPWSTIQSLLARRWWFDGEIFILKSHSKVAPYRPRIQLIETHRVDTPPDLYGQPNIIDGQELNSDGRTVAFYVLQGLENPTYQRVDASKIIHIYEPDRVGQLRGLPFCYPVINPIVDLGDLEDMEMTACKDAAEKSNIILNETGEMGKGQERRARYGNSTQTAAGVETSEARVRAVQKALGGRTVALKKGEEFKQFQPTRPSDATSKYWDYLIAKICLGHGIPKSVAFPGERGQGTIIRGDYDLANIFFRCRSGVLAAASLEVYNWSMGWHVGNDSRLSNPPKDWRKANTRPPRAINVDVGYNSAAKLAELDAGTTTFEDIYGEQGKDWRNRITQRGIEALFIKTEATRLGVTPGEIREQLKADIATSQRLS